MLRLSIGFLLLLGIAPAPADECGAPQPVCDARAAVFAVTSFDPFASAVRIAPDLLVTNRHVVADEEAAELVLPDGSTVAADVVPTSYQSDLVLLRSDGLPDGPVLEPSGADLQVEVFTVGADLQSGEIRVYPPGPILALPPDGLDLARLHTSAHSQPGNSGGALVNAEGELVAVVASGGEGRNEAIPAAEIEELIAESGPEHAAESGRIGAAYRACTEELEAAFGRRVAEADAAELEQSCAATGNRQMFDLAGQALGQSGHYDAAIALLQDSLAQDPNALNARVSLAVTYHLAGRYEQAITHLEQLLETAPGDLAILRLAMRTGMAAGDDALVRRARELMEEHSRERAPSDAD